VTPRYFLPVLASPPAAAAKAAIPGPQCRVVTGGSIPFLKSFLAVNNVLAAIFSRGHRDQLFLHAHQPILIRALRSRPHPCGAASGCLSHLRPSARFSIPVVNPACILHQVPIQIMHRAERGRWRRQPALPALGRPACHRLRRGQPRHLHPPNRVNNSLSANLINGVAEVLTE
jgi:hypothetical protein